MLMENQKQKIKQPDAIGLFYLSNEGEINFGCLRRIR